MPLRHGNSILCAFKPNSLGGFSLLQRLPCRCLFSSCSSVYLLSRPRAGWKPKVCFGLGCSPARLAAHNQPHSHSPVLPWPNHNLPRVPRDSHKSDYGSDDLLGKNPGASKHEETCDIAVGHAGNAHRRVGLCLGNGNIPATQPELGTFRLYKHISGFVKTCSVGEDSAF